MQRFTATARAGAGGDVILTGFTTLPGGFDSKVLVDKRQMEKNRMRGKERTVADLIDAIAANSSKPTKQKVLNEFLRLQQAARKIVGNDVPLDVVDSASVFLFDVFLSDQAWSRNHAEEIKGTLGPFPASAASDACSAVKQIIGLMPKDWEYKTRGDSTMQLCSTVKEFGHNIAFKHIEPEAQQGNVGYDSLSDEEYFVQSTEFLSGVHHNTVSSMVCKNHVLEMNEKMVGPSSRGSKYIGEWLQRQCQSISEEKTTTGLDWKDLYSAAFELLSSYEENSAIENNLAELLGFSSLDLIQEILVHRQEIVHSVLRDSVHVNFLKPSVAPKVKETIGAHSTVQRPALGSQIIIQSAEEKQLKKLVRKEEKKIAKQVKDLEAAGVDDQETRLQLLGYDPEVLRRQRVLSLEEAFRRPLLTGRRAYQTDPSDLYPHVYDSLAKAKLTSAFIVDSKVSIPEDAQRKNDSVKEEIVIPHTSTAPPPVGNNCVKISELDDTAQVAFRGTTSLNRIQSVVFDTAYHSNENLLISAPTGAGKTNIAMLTVLHEIKNNIGDDGVIKRDNFKIIYVAPMKALASEMVRNFGSRLSPLGVSVKELTGDMQLTKAEIHKSQMIVTTPEKWDVVTRKATGDVQLAQIVRLLIIDEVHLLHEDRGAVIECLVARTLRQVESSQSMIRIVGLSATLPNYIDVAKFLRVNPYQGLFFFDGRFRPVPLSQTFIGVKNPNRIRQLRDMEEVCYEKVLANVKSGYQVMVFVHARNATVKTAMALRDLAASYGDLSLFSPEQSPQFGQAQKQVERSRNKPVRDLFKDGFSTHHAGMLRIDRNLVERLFSDGLIKVLVCTATLAWGINLPAHAVIIKGTQIYDSKKGSFVDIGILDVLQIFGRAGRPQFDRFGEGTILTTHDKLSHYLSLLTRQQPIESQLITSLYDNLNAEIALGTVTSVEEAVQWLTYTYLFIRMKANPLVYGIPHDYTISDPQLENYRIKLIVDAARKLDKARMVRFVEHTGALHATDLGRTASHFYINYASIEVFNELLRSRMTEDVVLSMVAKSDEFQQLKVREDESSELSTLYANCYLPVKEGVDSSYGKVNILLQAFISREVLDSFSLTSDLSYVAQNAGRILRGLFEISLKKNLPAVTHCMLTLCKCVDHRQWAFEHPLRQFPGSRLTPDILNKLEGKKASLARLKDMSDDEIGHLVSHVRMGSEVRKLVNAFPSLQLAASVQPITRTVLKVSLTVTPDFEWKDKIHGSTSEPWWVWVEDAESNHMYHSEHFLLQKKQVLTREVQSLVFTIPIFEPLPPQYFVRVISDRWLHAEAVVAISFKHLILPELHPPHTKLLDLHPLPITALSNPNYEQLYNFPYFNPVQTQIFHTLYHSDNNVLVGAPTGSGKTVAAELAIFRMFNHSPGGKAVYIAPLKALVRERIQDWKIRLEQRLNRRIVELTGDTSPDIRAIERADVIVTTPEKWDGISRSWQNRKYVQAMCLLVIDEIHLLGDERGPVLEVIVSRTNFIASHTEQKVRVVGLSTALANAKDLANWLSIKPGGLFNFHPAVRPVQLEVHIEGFPGRHYCPRMATMNKPAFTAIQTYSPDKPVLIFVSSRRQTRLTAFDLVAYLGARDNPKQWLHLQEHEMDGLLQRVSDPNLRFSLGFGIGLHHAGLGDKDRKLVEELFVNQKIHVLIATSTLAWGVNFPAHLVIVKGTEYFDGKTQRYVDYPITDVLQMMGRAGRPQYDDKGVAVILVHNIKKHYYKKFLYEPFPVESNLLEVLADHMNAEIVAGTITSKQDAMDYVTWTYFFRRLVMNPSYYQLQETTSVAINSFLSDMVTNALTQLQNSYCIEVEEDDRTVHPLTLGCISSYYYLHHTTVGLFREKLTSDSTFGEVLWLLCDSSEYNELPVRHNEDGLNRTLSTNLPLPVVPPESFDSPHTKTHLLLQAHFSRVELPIADYVTDTKSVLDQSLRILQSMVDICADEGWLCTTLRVMHLVQMCVQGRWLSDSSILILPYLTTSRLNYLNQIMEKSSLGRSCKFDDCLTLPEVIVLYQQDEQLLTSAVHKVVQSESHTKEIISLLVKLPLVSMKWRVKQKSHGAEYSTCVMPASVKERKWTGINASSEEECIVQLELCRKSLSTAKVDCKALCSRFSKAKDEGWWVLLGEVDSGELLALKRIGFFSERTRISLAFTAPHESCRKIYSVYMISDCYLGLDQQLELYFNFTINEETVN